MKKILCYFLVGSLLLIGCSKSYKPAKTVSIEPTEMIIKKNNDKEFSVVLDDMKIEEEPDYMVYQQKYNILTLVKDSLHTKKTPWQTVSKKYFKKHENDLGMEIVSNHNGRLSRVAQPVGFGWAIGDKKHGEWEETSKDSTKTSNHHRRWRTHGTSPFFWYWLGTRRNTYRNDFNSYQSHYRSGKPYYGYNNSNYSYGTRSAYERTNRSSFFSRKVQNMSKWNSLNRKVSRSSSRYSSGSSTRSRSGGFGK
ncbi:hypothetical protein [Tenacibaculum singaporense]|uniref:hypothetical protein n=1 Tax=Tenacibaculum singaporense TaxID=2358479 RepID=UPI000F6620D0|nr:hypothetical protein [Tenacibaculum singaporense]RSC95144.1 hypothetical protein EI424_05715 [Tenacibaculum singaporense]